MFSKTLLATTVAATLFTPTAFAQDSSDNTIIVTASRVAESIDDTLASVTVITQQDIQKQQASSIHEVLAGHIGITTVNKGGYGKDNSVFLRGGNSSHTLVLLNGVRLGSATNGSVPLQNINIDQIERIEIVRGPLSSLYGSDAISGVIHIITKKDTSGFSANLSSGTNNTQKAGANINAGSEKLRASLQVNSFSTDGINAKENSNPDKDGFKSNSANLFISGEANKSLSFEMMATQTTGTNQYDGWENALEYDTDFKNQVIATKLKSRIDEKMDLTFNLSELRDESDNPAEKSYFNTLRNAASIQADYYFDSDIVSFGIDTYKDKVSSNNDYSEDERENNALFMQYQGYFSDLSLQMAYRHDKNEASGSANTGNINLGFPISQQTQLHVSYGNAFKAPTINDLYYPASANSSGNEDLLPEESLNFEIGIKQSHNNASYELNIFRTKVTNLIEWACTAGPIDCNDTDWSNDFWQPSNVASATMRGIELSFSQTIDSWNFGLNTTLLQAKDATSGNDLARRPNHTINLHLSHHGEKITSHFSLLTEGSRYEDPDNIVELEGYTIFSTAFTYQVDDPLSVKLEVANLFDVHYQTAKGYNTLGRTALITLNYQH